MPWLHRAHARGIDILVGDPGRRYLPTNELLELAAYDVRSTADLEDLDRSRARVYALRPADEITLVADGCC
jgi:predicted nicotinamide N-methyase